MTTFNIGDSVEYVGHYYEGVRRGVVVELTDKPNWPYGVLFDEHPYTPLVCSTDELIPITADLPADRWLNTLTLN